SSEIRRAFADVVSAGLAKSQQQVNQSPLGLEGSEVSDGGSTEEIEGCPDGASYGVSSGHPLFCFYFLGLGLWKRLGLEDAIAANRSRAEKKKKCRVVCHTYEIGSAHHARSDDIPVSVPTVAPQGLAILLVDAATQTKISKDKASPRLLRSKSLPPMYNLDWP
ncbi:hypothetical protein Tco_1073603, partial [Tanacetum coccineum]